MAGLALNRGMQDLVPAADFSRAQKVIFPRESRRSIVKERWHDKWPELRAKDAPDYESSENFDLPGFERKDAFAVMFIRNEGWVGEKKQKKIPVTPGGNDFVPR